MRKLRPENLLKLKLWVYSWWSSLGQKGIPHNSRTTSTSAKHWWSFKSQNHVLMKSDSGARLTFPCLNLGNWRSPEFLNGTILLCKQLGYLMPSTLILRGIKGGRRGGGEGIIAMQYLRSLVPEWLWCDQDFLSLHPSPPSTPPLPIHPLSFKGSVFPLSELYLGLSEAQYHSFPLLPHPHKKPGGHRPGNT